MIYPSIYTEPFGSLTHWGSLFDGFIDGPSGQPTPRSWVPTMDFEDRGDVYQVAVDLPGIDPGDVDISLDDDILKISGERTIEKATDDTHHYTHIERAYGAFQRTLKLPADIDPDSVEAHGEHGVLRIRIGKQPSTKPRHITVQAH